MRSLQVPPLWHGFGLQSSMSVNRKSIVIVIYRCNKFYRQIFILKFYYEKNYSNLTNFAFLSSESLFAVTFEIVDEIFASSPIMTWVWPAVINVCGQTSNCYN